MDSRDVWDALACAVFQENFLCSLSCDFFVTTFTFCRCSGCKQLLQLRSVWLCDWFSVHRWPAICERIVTLKLPCEDNHQLFDRDAILPILHRVGWSIWLERQWWGWRDFHGERSFAWVHGVTCGLHSTLLYAGSLFCPVRVKKLESVGKSLQEAQNNQTVVVYNTHITNTYTNKYTNTKKR